MHERAIWRSWCPKGIKAKRDRPASLQRKFFNRIGRLRSHAIAKRRCRDNVDSPRRHGPWCTERRDEYCPMSAAKFRRHPMSAARFMMIPGAPAPVAPFSHAVEVDGWMFLTGQMPTD